MSCCSWSSLFLVFMASCWFTHPRVFTLNEDPGYAGAGHKVRRASTTDCSWFVELQVRRHLPMDGLVLFVEPEGELSRRRCDGACTRTLPCAVSRPGAHSARGCAGRRSCPYFYKLVVFGPRAASTRTFSCWMYGEVDVNVSEYDGEDFGVVQDVIFQFTSSSWRRRRNRGRTSAWTFAFPTG